MIFTRVPREKEVELSLLVGQTQLSAAGRERGVVEFICLRCRGMIVPGK